MATVERNLAITMGVADDRSQEDLQALPRTIVLVEVREVLDIRLTDVRGGF